MRNTVRARTDEELQAALKPRPWDLKYLDGRDVWPRRLEPFHAKIIGRKWDGTDAYEVVRVDGLRRVTAWLWKVSQHIRRWHWKLSR